VKRTEDAGKSGVENRHVVQGQAIGDHVGVRNSYGPLPRPPTPRTPPSAQLWTIPFPRNPFFVGQEDLLTQLHRRLTRGTPTAVTQVQAISGLGGIGKTQLAIEYAYRYRKSYPFVFWIRAEHLETLVADLMSLASLLQLPEQDETDQMKVVRAVKQWLVTHQGWLLIFDNADDLSLLSPFLPQPHPGAILLTTRASQTHPLAEPLLVEQMDERVGAEFLLHRARLLALGQALEEATPADQRAARRLCQLVGGLPLALDQAGAYIDETQCRVQDYLTFYQQDQQVRARLLRRRGKVIAGHPEPVATTWALAFARVQQANPAAAELLRACAFLAPDLIPEELLRQGAHSWGPALESVAASPFQWNEMIGELLKYGLVRRSREHQALSLHRLVQTVLKDAMDEPTRQQWVEHTVQTVERVFPGGTEPANWPTCQRLLPHAQTCIEEHDLNSQEGANLLHRMANYLSEHASYSEAEPLLQRALGIWEQQLGPEHPNMAYPLNDLAILYVEQGKYGQAEPLLQRALHIWEQQLGPEHLEVAYPLNSLANLYYYQGKYEQAELLYQRALCIREQRLGPEHPFTQMARRNYASLLRVMGREVEARKLEESS
jgi:tetratricopeptide (TPR) repeat protein